MMRTETVSNQTDRLAVYTLLGLLAALGIAICLMASVPPVSRDALTHHLAVPKLYLARGAVYEIPEIKFSYYPMNLDLLYMIPLYFGNDIFPKFIHFAFGIATAWLIYTYLRRRISLSYGMLGALFFMSVPVIVTLSVTVYVDLGEMFFSFSSILLFLKWLEDPSRKKTLIFSALSCGLALGTKYNGLIFFLIISAMIPIFILRSHRNRSPVSALGCGVLFVAVSLVVFSPWLIRNLVWTGNPVYPLFNGFFQGAAAETAPKWSPFLIRKIIYHETWWETLAIPIRIFFQGRENDPQFFDGRLNPFLPILAIIGFYDAIRHQGAINREALFFLIFSMLYILFVFFTADMRIRYMSAAIPPLVVLSMFGFHSVVKTAARFFPKSAIRKIVPIFLSGVILLPNGLYIRESFASIRPLEYLTGKISRDSYIQKFRPEYASILYANENLNDGDCLFALFIGNRRYYCDRDMIFDIPRFKNIVMDSESPAEMVTHLASLRATHLLVAFELFEKWVAGNFDQEKQEMIQSFFKKKTQRLFLKDGHGLFAIVEKNAADLSNNSSQ